jgi:hypothetical protein
VVESGVHFLWFLLVRSSSVVGSNCFLILSDVALFLCLMRKSHDLESAFWRTIGRASSLISISIGVFVYSSSKFELNISTSRGGTYKNDCTPFYLRIFQSISLKNGCSITSTIPFLEPRRSLGSNFSRLSSK